jgi:orotate phosphoribosyltransferase
VERIDPGPSQIEQEVLGALAAARGHFVYESGHHGDLWLDLDTLFIDARRARGWAAALASRWAGLAQQDAGCRPEVVCGPLVGGAFLAQWMAAELGAGFVFADRLVSEGGPARYRIPGPLRGAVSGRRVLLVDDAVNAGSALRATLADLTDCGAELAGLASLLTSRPAGLALGSAPTARDDAASQIARQHGVPYFTLVCLERGLWLPEACPLCASGVPLSQT